MIGATSARPIRSHRPLTYPVEIPMDARRLAKPIVFSNHGRHADMLAHEHCDIAALRYA